MPRLPSPDGPRATPRSSGGIVDYGQRSDAGIQSVARSVSDYAGQVQEKEDAFAYASAKSQYLIEQSNFMREIEQDGDFDTYEERYSERSKQALEKVSTKLRPRDREVFGMEMELQQQRGLEQTRDLALNKKRDFRRGELIRQTDEMIKIYSDPNTPPIFRDQFPRALSEIIDSAGQDGTISVAEAEAEKIKVREQAVEGRALALIKSGKYQAAQELLDTEAARIALAPARIAELKGIGDEESQYQLARNEADRILSMSGGDRKKANALATDIGDAKVRQQTQSFIDGDLHRVEVVKSEQQEEDFNFFADQIMRSAEEGQNPLEALKANRTMHPERWYSLSPENRASIEKMTTGDQKYTDNATFTEFNDILRLAGPEDAGVFLRNNVGSLSPPLYRSLSEKLSSPEAVDEYITDSQRIKAFAEQGGKKPEDLQIEYDRRVRLENESAKQQGKVITPERKNEILENLIVENADWSVGQTVELEGEERELQFQYADLARKRIQSDPKAKLGEEVERITEEIDAAYNRANRLGISVSKQALYQDMLRREGQ